MSEQKQMVIITWETIWEQRCEKEAPESEAEEEAERLRTLPDVKTHTVEVKEKDATQ